MANFSSRAGRLLWPCRILAGFVSSLVFIGFFIIGTGNAELGQKLDSGFRILEDDLIAQAAVSPIWLPEGNAFWYRHELSGGRFEFVFVDAAGKTQKPAFDHGAVAKELGRLTNQAIDSRSLPFHWIDPESDASGVRFSVGKRAWSVSSEGSLEEWNGTVSDEQDHGSNPEVSKTPSDMGTSAEFPKVFIRNFNVWVAYRDKDEHQITANGTKDNPFDEDRIYVSPDGQHAAVWQYTPEQEHKVTLLESSPTDQLQPKLKAIQYLKPGDRVQIDRPRLFDLDRRSEIPTDDTLFRNPYDMMNVGWDKNSIEYRFIFNERGHQTLRVIGMDRNGRVRALVEEKSKTFINYAHKLYHRVINNTDELLWASERDGWNHLYLYDLSAEGKLQNQVTKGEWVVNSVEKVDTAKRQIWFRGYGMVSGQDPYYAHLARVNFDGSGLKILTEGDGTHSWKWSPDQRYLTDTWSRVDYPPTSVLRDAETGEKLMTLQESNATDLRASGWNGPERFTALGRDGKTEIYGIIIRPSNFDANKKYPVLEDIYAGPQDFFTPKAFSNLTSHREWADRGYVVVKLDGMGTNWRSKAFHDVCYKNLKDAGFLDRIAWMRAAAATRPWMDLSRVGVKGGSAGGQNAAAALLFHGDFYKVAAADSGCHDNRMDKIWWNEQWMGYPVDKSYEDSSNVVHAGKLEGALMLIVGDLDDNVDPSSTLQVVNALNKADKDYEFLFIPGGRHGCGGTPYGKKRQAEFFRRHLQGA